MEWQTGNWVGLFIVDPLAEARPLEVITLPPNARDIEFFRRITTIRHISYTEESNTYLPDKTADKFSREYDELTCVRVASSTFASARMRPQAASACCARVWVKGLLAARLYWRMAVAQKGARSLSRADQRR